MSVIYGLLIVVSIAFGLAFVVAYGDPRRNETPSMAWLQAGLAWVALIFDAIFLLAVFRVFAPWWIVLIALLGQDIVFGWRLYVLFAARREKSSNERS